MRAISNQQNYSLSFNRVKQNSLIEIYINYLSGDANRFESLESQIVYLTQDIGDFFDNIKIELNNCSAFLINFNSDECNEDIIRVYSREKGSNKFDIQIHIKLKHELNDRFSFHRYSNYTNIFKCNGRCCFKMFANIINQESS